LAKIDWFAKTCFFNVVIPFDVLHKLNHFFLELMGLKLELNIIKNDTTHDLKRFNINIFIIFGIIDSQHNVI
jgi:hypothetical protein